MMKQDSVSNRKVFRIDQILMPAYLCSLVLEPHLHDSHRQSSLSRQSFSDLQQQYMHEMYIRAVSTHNTLERPVTADLSAGFGRHLEGSLEGAPLLCGQDGSWSLRSLVLFPIIPSLPPNRDTTTILILTLYCKGKLSIGLKVKRVISGLH